MKPLTKNEKDISSWENEGGFINKKQNSIKLFFQNPPITIKLGKETKNSLKYFNIGHERFNIEFIKSLLVIKMSVLEANYKFKHISKEKYNLINESIKYLIDHTGSDYFPVKVWQTGSGTQINMNINETIASLANELAKSSNLANDIHPNNHINLSQSSNDVIPSALNLTCINLMNKRLLPALKHLEEEICNKEKEFKHIVKISRTHMMDAVPMSLGDEISSFSNQLEEITLEFKHSLKNLKKLALGGTAIGSGINCPSEVSKYSIKLLSKHYDIKLERAHNLYAAISTHNEITQLSSNLKNLAIILLKLSNDITLLASGPDAGLNELILPSNEAGSSIMPGKVNPTQCEALAMVACQVMGNDHAISLGSLQGKLQLNTFMPLIIKNMIDSINLLSDSIISFTDFCIKDLKPNLETLEQNVGKSKMIITTLIGIIGYDKAKNVVDLAFKNKLSIKEQVLKMKLINEEELDKLFYYSPALS